MFYIPLICILIFHILFFAKSIGLSLSLNQSIRTMNKPVTLSILGVITTIGLFCSTLRNIGRFEDMNSVHYSGLVLMAIACIIGGIALYTMHDSRRIGIPKNTKTELVTHGIYSYSRNPFFLAYDMLIIGMIIFSGSGLVFISGMITILLFHNLILDEEKYLKSIHGEEYKNYQEQTRRYV